MSKTLTPSSTPVVPANLTVPTGGDARTAGSLDATHQALLDGLAALSGQNDLWAQFTASATVAQLTQLPFARVAGSSLFAVSGGGIVFPKVGKYLVIGGVYAPIGVTLVTGDPFSQVVSSALDKNTVTGSGSYVPGSQFNFGWNNSSSNYKIPHGGTCSIVGIATVSSLSDLGVIGSPLSYVGTAQFTASLFIRYLGA